MHGSITAECNRFVKQPGQLNLLWINKPLETDLQLVSILLALFWPN